MSCGFAPYMDGLISSKNRVWVGKCQKIPASMFTRDTKSRLILRSVFVYKRQVFKYLEDFFLIFRRIKPEENKSNYCKCCKRRIFAQFFF